MANLRDKFIDKMRDDFELLSTITLRQMDKTLSLTQDNKNEKTYAAIDENEKIIDSLEVKIRDEVINTIALYSPRAIDSRKIISYHDMTGYLERVGDLLLNIADFFHALDRKGFMYQALHQSIEEQLLRVKEMIKNAIFAFTCEDEELARQVIAQDDSVDTLHREITRSIPLLFTGKTMNEQDMSDALSISNMSYNIERIGDNATNIAEAAIYLMDGKNAKHIHNTENKQNNE